MDLFNDLCSPSRAGQLPNLFIPDMLIGTSTIQFGTFTDLDLAWWSHGQRKAKHFGFIFSHTFHVNKMKFNMVLKQCKLNIPILFLRKIQWNKGNNCCSTDIIKELKCWHAFRQFWINLIQTFYDVRDCNSNCDSSLTDLDHDSRSQEWDKVKTSVPIISQSFQSIWMVFGLLLRLVCVLDLILISCHPFHIQEREPYWFDLRKNKLVLYSDNNKPISFKLGLMIETGRLYILIFIQGHSYMRNHKHWCPFSHKFKYWFGWKLI